MATEIIKLDATPRQITSGTDSALVSLRSGPSVCFFAGESAPADKSGYDLIKDRLIVAPPLSVWVWSDNPRGAEISLTKW